MKAPHTANFGQPSEQPLSVAGCLSVLGLLLMIVVLFVPWYNLPLSEHICPGLPDSCSLNGLTLRTNFAAVFAVLGLLYCVAYPLRGVMNVSMKRPSSLSLILGIGMLGGTLADLVNTSIQIGNQYYSIAIGWVLALVASVIMLASGTLSLIRPRR